MARVLGRMPEQPRHYTTQPKAWAAALNRSMSTTPASSKASTPSGGEDNAASKTGGKKPDDEDDTPANLYVLYIR